MPFVRIVLVPEIIQYIWQASLDLVFFIYKFVHIENALCRINHQNTQSPHNAISHIVNKGKLDFAETFCEPYLSIMFQNLIHCIRFQKHSPSFCFYWWVQDWSAPLHFWILFTALPQFEVVAWLIYNMFHFVVKPCNIDCLHFRILSHPVWFFLALKTGCVFSWILT